jgi:hypothetical protein
MDFEESFGVFVAGDGGWGTGKLKRWKAEKLGLWCPGARSAALWDGYDSVEAVLWNDSKTYNLSCAFKFQVGCNYGNR